MESYYLIDFENVNSAGLESKKLLTDQDTVIIFFTKNASKIDMSVLSKVDRAKLQFIEVPSGKQSLDMHLSSFVGNLLSEAERRIVVVSKDHDYDSIIKFWKTRLGADIERIDSMSDCNSGSISTRVSIISSPYKLEQSKVLNEIGYTDVEIKYVEKLIGKHLNEKNGKQQIYRSIVSKYGQEQGLKLYRDVKKIFC
ncbi:hypothetical protein SAMN02910384_02096 [Pseudobutyrivibrio sp. ACV-2]|uniref:PIN domain-containing protein n=1 Tax=Pseudobutyrivibrio sp. ACV-2 TaxID=1520801 RepID=UPI0008966567|nr:PIN domain-containing protein [Pseudobutyrivibrio sp. ACV-2]SEA70332.1 hypothetical protein SAMN02910384_02096 [Pseudobutyrivibrio sp. ACV-2]